MPSDTAAYRPAPDLLAERVILVTGAGDGIGRAVAEGCAAHGATVVLLGKTVRKLEAVYDAIEAAGGPQPAIYPMHLEGAGPADIDQLAATIERQLGRLDGLIHCAAHLPYLSRLKDHEIDDWVRTLQVNLTAPFLLGQALLPLLTRAEDASMIFTGDRVGTEARPFWGAYGVAKAGVETLARMWATELERTPVRVNLIDPGPTLTALRKRAFPGEENAGLQTPEAVVPAYLRLLDPALGLRGSVLRLSAE